MTDPPFVIDNLIDAASGVIERCALEQPGRYRRVGIETHEPGDAELNPYGVADAANLLYTLDQMPTDARVRQGFVDSLGELQDPQTGLFKEATHAAYHTTAHCIAALELFNELPAHRLTAMKRHTTPDGVVELLEELQWVNDPWSQSHLGAGIYAAVKLSRQLPSDDEARWERAYFDWLIAQFDPETGLLRKGCLPGEAANSTPLHHHMAGTFHYLFNMHSARVAIPYPERLIDTCLTMRLPDADSFGLTDSVSFITVDWVFCMHRAWQQCGHRTSEVKTELEAVARELVAYLRELDHSCHRSFNDLHLLFGTFCALAELQLAVPGVIRSRRALRQVLDRRPFV